MISRAHFEIRPLKSLQISHARQKCYAMNFNCTTFADRIDTFVGLALDIDLACVAT